MSDELFDKFMNVLAVVAYIILLSVIVALFTLLFTGVIR